MVASRSGVAPTARKQPAKLGRQVAARRTALASIVRPGRPSVRTTFQLAAYLESAKGSPGSTLLVASNVVLKWMAAKFPSPLPAKSRSGASFVSEQHGQSIRVASIPEQGLWAARLTHPDLAVPGRTWTTEIGLAVGSGASGGGSVGGQQVRVAIRVLCASLPSASAPVELSRPRVVLDLARAFTLVDARPILPTPWSIERREELAELQALLVDSDRHLPVFLLTQPDERRIGLKLLPFLLDERALAKRLQGLATVVTLPRSLNLLWSARVGNVWSAYEGAVRTYRPGLDFKRDSPANHPRAWTERVLAFEHKGKTAEQAFADFLVEQAHALSATKRVDWSPCLFYADVVQREAEAARAKARTNANEDGEWRTLYQQEVDALRKHVEESDGLAASYAEDVSSLREQIEEQEAEARRLRAALDSLRQQLEAKTGKSPGPSVPIPDAYEGLEEWVEKHLAGRLQLHPRAEQGLKHAIYKDVALVYRALLALAIEYRNMRLRPPDDEAPKIAWDQKLRELGLECDGSISATRARQEGDTYFVSYPLGSSSNCFLDSHLRKGKAKDDELCLAIYFFWDDERSRVVVGWLPGHLDNRMT